MTGSRPLLLVTGIAPGLGASIARAFAAGGHDVLGLSRSNVATEAVERLVRESGGTYVHRACDLTHATAVQAAIGADAPRIAAFVHNAHALAIASCTETALSVFENAWRVGCFGAMAAAQAILPDMMAQGRGTILFIGATASLRGGANFSAFASAKFAVRGLAQSLARECGPRGVHVAHVIVDGLIDAPQTTARFGPARKLRIDPDSVAQTLVALARQSPSAWTHELDLRPHSETF
jgi:NAD(P)-dependent dehydrogenase (short-subunit alcohol dehydrogenase family)